MFNQHVLLVRLSNLGGVRNLTFLVSFSPISGQYSFALPLETSENFS